MTLLRSTSLFATTFALMLSAQQASAQTAYIPVKQALTQCVADGTPIPQQTKSPLTKLDRDASLAALAYINHVYQNDTQSKRFCQVMLGMDRQVTSGAPGDYDNPFAVLFQVENASKILPALADAQAAFNYSINRFPLPTETVQASVDNLKTLLN